MTGRVGKRNVSGKDSSESNLNKSKEEGSAMILMKHYQAKGWKDNNLEPEKFRQVIRRMTASVSAGNE